MGFELLSPTQGEANTLEYHQRRNSADQVPIEILKVVALPLMQLFL